MLKKPRKNKEFLRNLCQIGVTLSRIPKYTLPPPETGFGQYPASHVPVPPLYRRIAFAIVWARKKYEGQFSEHESKAVKAIFKKSSQKEM